MPQWLMGQATQGDNYAPTCSRCGRSSSSRQDAMDRHERECWKDDVVFRRISFFKPEIVINESPLKRRVLGFCLNKARLVLYYDIDEERATKRHQFRRTNMWSRLDKRDCTMERRDVPESVIELALESVRGCIKYSESP